MLFGLLKFGSFRGIGMIILQIIRILTVIGLTTGAIACWAMVLHVPKHGAYFVFEAASLVFISFFCTFLVVSEFPMIKFVRNMYRRSWPLFSDQHGPGWLGLAVILIGCNLIGKLNEPSFDIKKMGKPVWQLSLAGGILNTTFGVLNVIASLIWMDRKNGINAKDVRSKGSLAEPHQHILPSYSESSSPASSIRNEKTKSKFISRIWHGTTNNDQGNSRVSTFGKRFSRPVISAPFQAHPVVESDAGRHDHHDDHHDDHHAYQPPTIQEPPIYGDDDDSLNDRRSPILPGVTRPETALHPLYSRSSKYSVATGITRF